MVEAFGVAWQIQAVAAARHYQRRQLDPLAIGPVPTGRAQTSTEELGFQLFAIRELRTYAVTAD